jgi:coenzyme F420-0:L-glutamate ligase/coenzyme F420-1:gamma-L-glutamate ligase
MKEVRLIGLDGLPEVRRGQDIAELIVEAAKREGVALEPGDVVVIAHKIVSKAEGRVIDLGRVRPSEVALKWAKLLRKDPRLLEVILRETKRVVRMARGVLICETRHGYVCANAGVDQSNAGRGKAVLLPTRPDASARRIRKRLEELTGLDLPVIITDTFGRPWRLGQVDVALGFSGMSPFLDYRGMKDKFGYELKVTMPALVDEVAAAAELAMGKLAERPVVIIKGLEYQRGEYSSRTLVRRPGQDLFR